MPIPGGKALPRAPPRGSQKAFQPSTCRLPRRFYKQTTNQGLNFTCTQVHALSPVEAGGSDDNALGHIRKSSTVNSNYYARKQRQQTATWRSHGIAGDDAGR